jgi:hypothetical protein
MFIIYNTINLKQFINLFYYYSIFNTIKSFILINLNILNIINILYSLIFLLFIYFSDLLGFFNTIFLL